MWVSHGLTLASLDGIPRASTLNYSIKDRGCLVDSRVADSRLYLLAMQHGEGVWQMGPAVHGKPGSAVRLEAEANLRFASARYVPIRLPRGLVMAPLLGRRLSAA